MDELTIALKLLQFALEIAPELTVWIGNLVNGKTDPVSIRVQAILPVESESAKAVKALGGGQ